MRESLICPYWLVSSKSTRTSEVRSTTQVIFFGLGTRRHSRSRTSQECWTGRRGFHPQWTPRAMDQQRMVVSPVVAPGNLAKGSVILQSAPRGVLDGHAARREICDWVEPCVGRADADDAGRPPLRLPVGRTGASWTYGSMSRIAICFFQIADACPVTRRKRNSPR